MASDGNTEALFVALEVGSGLDRFRFVIDDVRAWVMNLTCL